MYCFYDDAILTDGREGSINVKASCTASCGDRTSLKRGGPWQGQCELLVFLDQSLILAGPEEDTSLEKDSETSAAPTQPG